MKSQQLFNSYSKSKAWGKSISNFKSALGLDSEDLSSGGLDIENLIGTLSSMSTVKMLKMFPAHQTSVMHLKLALQESGVDPASLSKKKVSLLSFLLNALGFEKFDEVIDLVVHDGSFLDIKNAMESDDKSFTNIIFSVLKSVFPPLAAIEGVIKGALKFI